MRFVDPFDTDIARAMDTVSVSTLTRAQRRAIQEEEAAAAGFDLHAYHQEEERKNREETGQPIHKWARWHYLRSHRIVRTNTGRLRVDCSPKFCARCGERLWEEEYVKVLPTSVWRNKPKTVVGTETVRTGKNRGKKRERRRIRRRTLKNLYTCWEHS